uniref:SH3 domain-containing protein n=1 Tax=Panagrolaimus sp. PS1159 TaxID=55785 RepID=A0AC35FAY7_9BILA
MSMNQISGDQIQEQAKIISQVHRQLAAAFHPALKHVAAAGVIYQKTQEANQKALSDYLLTLTQLVDSAKEAEEQTQECVQQLKAVIPIIKKFNDQQSQLITEFSEITRKVHANAEGEKDSHRKMLNNYLKEQRQIHKEVEKKRKTQKDLWEFYEQKKQDAIRLQYLRYNFFTDKHISIVKNFLNTSMEANNELARIFGMEEKNIEEHQNAMAVVVESQKRENIVSPENIGENLMPSPVLQHSSQRLQRLPTSETFPPYDGTITNFLNNLEDSPKIPTPRAQVYEQREIVADPYPPLPPLPLANPLAPIYRPPTPIQQRPIPPPPREVIEPTVHPLPRPLPKTVEPQPYVTRERPLSQPSYQYNALERPVTILPNQPIQQQQQQLPPVIQPRKEKQIFTASDYGSILVCTMPYTARTDRQLSLNVNEQVQLIRSGERGLGWFPAKFVRKATSEEINPQSFQ